MKIDSLKNYYVIVDKNGKPDFLNVSRNKNLTIRSFIVGSQYPWSYWKNKLGYKCVKVDIHFNVVM